ncbi:tight adherence pilus pseudopilin TadF [Erwinia oleae]|uniref:tight adherence pilus pseudopilin TadF n=1 Tax=Erwinia oleae TaxID=796334 RepID=UPI00054D8D8E|nr:tight adherence pilus pseudopilin TadF [Erwinia oleae]
MMINLKTAVRDFSDAVAGSILTEAAFIFTVLVSLCVGAIDYGGFIAQRGRIESVSYSLASVLRERKHLFDDREMIIQEDVDRLAALTATLLDHPEAANFCLSVESVTFRPGEDKVVENYRRYNGGMAQCNNTRPAALLSDLTDLSVWSNRQRWIPIYQLTLIVPTRKSSLQTLSLLPDDIKAASIVIRR